MENNSEKIDWQVRRLNRFYPDIQYVEGEDLSLDNMYRRILSKCWYDVKKYPTVTSISLITGVSERTVFRAAVKYNFPPRSENSSRGKALQTRKNKKEFVLECV